MTNIDFRPTVAVGIMVLATFVPACVNRPDEADSREQKQMDYFQMAEDWTATHHPLTLAELNAAQARLGVVFPEEYKRFLLKFNGVYISEYFVDFPILDSARYGSNEGGIDTFYGIASEVDADDAKLHDLFAVAETLPTLRTLGVLPIGCSSMGDEICLGITPDNRHKVYFWDIRRSVEATDPEDALFLVANSFHDFLHSLHIDPD